MTKGTDDEFYMDEQFEDEEEYNAWIPYRHPSDGYAWRPSEEEDSEEEQLRHTHPYAVEELSSSDDLDDEGRHDESRVTFEEQLSENEGSEQRVTPCYRYNESAGKDMDHEVCFEMQLSQDEDSEEVADLLADYHFSGRDIFYPQCPPPTPVTPPSSRAFERRSQLRPLQWEDSDELQSLQGEEDFRTSQVCAEQLFEDMVFNPEVGLATQDELEAGVTEEEQPSRDKNSEGGEQLSEDEISEELDLLGGAYFSGRPTFCPECPATEHGSLRPRYTVEHICNAEHHVCVTAYYRDKHNHPFRGKVFRIKPHGRFLCICRKVFDEGKEAKDHILGLHKSKNRDHPTTWNQAKWKGRNLPGPG
ncbi:hypothetical protein B0H11DRAFT_1955960 [Mycena galericulata]|nr:hypothetical protein B0H11DRAFT_1955960 [Mycena galericulata]